MTWVFMSEDFKNLNINENILKALAKMKFEEPTPVQISSIPLILQGKDIIAQAQTGTGKTAAFGIPLIQLIHPQGRPSALILCPTRELGVQVADEIKKLAAFSKISVIPVYGGTSIDMQISALRKGVDIVVGTPGRVIDHIERGTLDLRGINFMVLDEADRMLDMGFIEDITFIMSKLPKSRHTMLFSATIPPQVRSLAEEQMRDATIVSVSEDEIVLPSTKQMFFAVGRKNKIWALCRILDKEHPKAIVFAETKRMVDIIDSRLKSYGYPAAAIHGDLTQARREKVLSEFRSGKTQVLIATDVAARGLDIEGVTYVINYDIPPTPEQYVHRIGRTGRAGKTGRSVTFVSNDEMKMLDNIESFTGVKLKQVEMPHSSSSARESVQEVLDFDEMSDIFGMVRFQISIGTADGASKVDMADLIVKNSKVNEIAIGSIEMDDSTTIVEVHKDVAMRVLRALRDSTFKNKRLEVHPLRHSR